MGAILSKTMSPTSNKDASASTNLGKFSQDEEVALVEEVWLLAESGEELPPLVQAVVAGGAGAVQRYLQEGGGLWERDRLGRTPLHWAAGAGSDCLVGALLALGAEVGARDRRLRTPLHHAAVGCNAVAAGHLLSAGASTDARDCNGRTPLMCAAKVGDVQLCQLLAADGPGPGLEAGDPYQQTALHLAARNGRDAAVKVLVAQGASVLALDDQLHTPLHSAFLFYEDMEMKVRRGDSESQSCTEDEGRDPATVTRQVLEGLLAGRDVITSARHRDNLGLTPLTWALRLRLPAVARVLLGVYRQDLDPDLFSMTALHWAALGGDAHVVRFLLEFDFSPWTTDSKGCDSLMLAVESRDLETVKGIVSGREYITHRNWMGQTALCIAVSFLDVEMTRCLLEAGSEVGSEDREGRTELFLALQAGEAGREVARLLLAAGAYPLQCGRTDRRRRTLLHAAAEGGDAELVRQLLRLGASPRALDDRGETPLGAALRLRRRDVLDVLMETREQSADDRGRAPLHSEPQVAGCDPAQRDEYAAAVEYGQWQLANKTCQWMRPRKISKAHKSD